MRLVGEVKIYKNGELVVEDKNTIRDPLKSYFETLMGNSVDKAVNDGFDSDGVTYGGGTGAEDGKDGILIRVGTTEYTMITTMISADNAFGKKWRGEYTNTSGAAQTISDFHLGHNFNSGSSPFFGTRYATYDPASFDMQDQDTVVLEWEIYIE